MLTQEKQKAYNQAYYASRKRKLRKIAKANYWANREHVLEQKREYYRANRERILARYYQEKLAMGEQKGD